MELSKYPLERLFSFVAGIIPGFVALLIYQLAVPGSFGWFFGLGFLGYRTKLIVILLTAFVIGNSMATFLRATTGAVGGVIGTRRAEKKPFAPAHTYEVAPWRDVRWRGAIRNRLGTQAPNDTRLMSDEILNLKRQAIEHLPLEQHQHALASLDLEKLSAEIDDGRWAEWYDQYHSMILNRDNPDVRWQVHYGLSSNLEVTAVYTLLSAILVPAVRHWWCLLPSCMWLFIFVAEEYSGFKRYTNRWSTLSEQIKYLSKIDVSSEVSGPMVSASK